MQAVAQKRVERQVKRVKEKAGRDLVARSLGDRNAGGGSKKDGVSSEVGQRKGGA